MEGDPDDSEGTCPPHADEENDRRHVFTISPLARCARYGGLAPTLPVFVAEPVPGGVCDIKEKSICCCYAWL